MQYLRIKKGQKRVRKDGSQWAEPIVIQKSRKYGEVISEKNISVKKPMLVTGPHDAGKTRWLERLHQEAQLIWGSKSKATPIWLAALRPLSAWTDVPHIAEWWDKKEPIGDSESQEPIKPWTKLKAWERVDALPNYVADTGAVVFLDDAHKLSGRKLDMARRCILASRIWMASTSQENRIPPNLRSVMLTCEPQTFSLDSDVAYDVTPVLMWVMIAVSAGMGAWEIAMALGGLKLLGSGRRASRQD